MEAERRSYSLWDFRNKNNTEEEAVVLQQKLLRDGIEI